MPGCLSGGTMPVQAQGNYWNLSGEYGAWFLREARRLSHSVTSRGHDYQGFRVQGLASEAEAVLGPLYATRVRFRNIA